MSASTATLITTNQSPLPANYLPQRFDMLQAWTPQCIRKQAAKPTTKLYVNKTPRHVITVLPAELIQKNQPVNLLIAFHGRTNSAEKVQQYLGLENNASLTAANLAVSNKALSNKALSTQTQLNQDLPNIVIYPKGLKDKSGRFTWWWPGDPANELRDFAFFDAIVKQYRQDFCVQNIYAVGYSLGASFVNTLGCARGDVLRGIASLGGGIKGSRCKGQVAALIMHNPQDRLVPIKYGLAAKNRLLKHNQFSTSSSPTLPLGYLCERYGGDSAYHPIVWCPHQNHYKWRKRKQDRYYPHNWPKGTGQVILNFFAKLP